MTEQTQVTPETTTTEAQVSAPPADTTSAAGGTPESPIAHPPESSPQALTAPAAPLTAYSPNFKYKYLSGDGSSRVEKEFEEWLRPLVKDADTEKKLRELHERAYGLDFVKSDRQKQKERADTVEAQHTQVMQQLQKVGQLKEAGDYDSAFEMLGFTQDEILKYAVKVAQMRQNPAQMETYQQQRQFAQKSMTLEQENAQLRAQQEQFAVQMRTQELDGALSRPDISVIAQSFDDRVGTPGAFRAEVIKRGLMHHSLNGKDISVDEAVGEVLSLVGPPPAQAQQAAVSAQTLAAPAQKPVIPNIAGKGTSPTKQIPKSVEDLRRMAAEAAEG
jgi:hypothetical protein